MVTLHIDDRKLTAREGETLLDAATRAGIPIPTLCHHPAVEDVGACRVCVVEITRPSWDGWSKLVTSCLYPVEEGLQVSTQSERVRRTRAQLLDLLLARCPDAPLIQQMARDAGVARTSYTPRTDADDCILCGLCVRACDRVGAHAITTAQRGSDKVIATPFGGAAEACVGCFACARICPTACIPFEEKQGVRRIWEREFALLTCKTCHAPFMTADERDLLVRRSGLDASYYEECPSCKRQRTASTFADVVLKTHPGFTPKAMGGTPPPLPSGTMRR
ncbi:MAG: 2Fe-2S iron-sulfur cluster-binding protein [Pseudomonadota bacterium]